MSLKPYWMDEVSVPPFPQLDRDIQVDVIVVGGGITGVTAAYLLKKAGKTVALLERDRCARVDTAHTTAHVTYVTDLRAHELVQHFGIDHARAAWEAGQAALERIHSIVHAEKIECGFTMVPGYLHAAWKDPASGEADKLREDAEAARAMGFDAEYMPRVPFADRPGVRFADQAKFHPLQYISGLLPRIPGAGSYVFEDSPAEEFDATEPTVKSNGRTVRGKYVVIATHVPLMGKAGLIGSTLFQTKIAPYSSYAVGAKIPKGGAPLGLFNDTADPYYYLRVDRRTDSDFVVFGGEDHKTGQEADSKECFRRLEETLKSILPHASVTHRWTGQVIETHDGLPYIGETADRQFTATGFSGNGMTFGTLSAMMAVDAATGRKNPWAGLFDVQRKKLSGAWDYIKENADYPYYLLRQKLAASEGQSLDAVKPGEGKILKLDGKRIAVYRDKRGEVTKLSPACTHMGCNVRWNQADSTWDCPCHGSRFRCTGEVIGGPAEMALEKAT